MAGHNLTSLACPMQQSSRQKARIARRGVSLVPITSSASIASTAIDIVNHSPKTNLCPAANFTNCKGSAPLTPPLHDRRGGREGSHGLCFFSCSTQPPTTMSVTQNIEIQAHTARRYLSATTEPWPSETKVPLIHRIRDSKPY